MPIMRWIALSSTTPIVTKEGAKTAPNHTKATPLVRKKDVRKFNIALEISKRELDWLLEGLDITRVKTQIVPTYPFFLYA